MKLNINTSISSQYDSDIQEGSVVKVKRKVPEALHQYANRVGTVTKVMKQYNVAEIDFGTEKKRIALYWLYIEA